MRLKRMLRHWQHGTAAVAWLLGSGTGAAWGQSVDTSMARARVDQPLSMTVLVRAFDGPASRITPDCLQVRVQQGESGEALAPLRLRTTPSGDDGRVAVHISSPQPVTDTVLSGRLSLHCGADYHRDFTVLVDPPVAASPSPAAPRAAAPSTRPSRAMRAPLPSIAPSASASASASAPALATALPAAWDDAQLQRLASAVAAALAPQHTEPPAQAGPALPTPPAPQVREAEHPWQDLRDEQRQTRASLAALAVRLERTERDAWRDALLVLGTVLGLSLALLAGRLVREGLLPRLEDRQPPAPRRLRDLDASPSPRPAVPEAPAPSPAEPPTPSRWPDADFGHPSLEHTQASQTLLAELEPLVHESPVGVALVLERRLQALTGPCPWILLRLLALYQQMEQPWNHERVAAQLQTLYNVRIPDMAQSGAADGLDLEDYPETLERIVQHWALDSAEQTLHSLLLRPAAVEALDRPAFETALLLHDLLRQRRSPWLTAIDGGALQTPEVVPVAAQGRDRLMELLAA